MTNVCGIIYNDQSEKILEVLFTWPKSQKMSLQTGEKELSSLGKMLHNAPPEVTFLNISAQQLTKFYEHTYLVIAPSIVCSKFGNYRKKNVMHDDDHHGHVFDATANL